jgi:hypothetical protein
MEDDASSFGDRRSDARIAASILLLAAAAAATARRDVRKVDRGVPSSPVLSKKR